VGEFERPGLTLHKKVRNAMLADHVEMNANDLKVFLDSLVHHLDLVDAV